MISIHAPLAGRDESVLPLPWGPQNFNPRAPCGARRGNGPSCRGCTDFNPRAPCGARHHVLFPWSLQLHFNPRAPCGARLPHYPGAFELHQFQSTRPLRGATLCFARKDGGQCHFNPRAPCGARHINAVEFLHGVLFQSTRPLRGATVHLVAAMLLCCISIHAPLAGRDMLAGRFCEDGQHFNPRAPCGARPPAMLIEYGFHNFNPRAPCGARPSKSVALLFRHGISIHAPLAGRDF